MTSEMRPDEPDPLLRNIEEPHWRPPDAEIIPAPQLPPEMYFLPDGPMEPVLRPRPRFMPNFGDALLFFVLAIVLLAVGQIFGIFVLQKIHLFGHHSYDSLFELSGDDARLSIPVQALSYALIAVVVIPVFSVMWGEPFSEGIHWNGLAARRRFVWLALLGLAAGFGITIFGGLLPMPKDPPITRDIMKSPLGAWLMLVFGLTAAPLLEELAFRGFLLPSLINFFRWLARLDKISASSAKLIGVPASILVTSLGFALMHSPQLSHSWGPLVLIGLVSIVLCVVRLAMDSVAAGVVVHAAYNLTLFIGVLIQTSGFRHLERLTG